MLMVTYGILWVEYNYNFKLYIHDLVGILVDICSGSMCHLVVSFIDS